MLAAFRDAGYALDEDDVAVLRTGLGTDADGRLDATELVGVCEDFASKEVMCATETRAYEPLDLERLPPCCSSEGSTQDVTPQRRRYCRDRVINHSPCPCV